MELASGATVTIKVKNPVWPMRRAYASYVNVPEFNTFIGTVVTKHKAIKEGQIGLTTDDPSFTMRVIDIDRIQGFESKTVSTAAESDYRTWTVTGSKNNEYTVTLDRGQYSCTCMGFAHRHTCKHIDGVRSNASD